MEDESIKSFTLVPGTTNNIRNHRPGPIYFRLETSGGSVITVKIPPTGEVKIEAGDDLVAGDLDIYPIDYNGPRPID